jgi:hypothetical protein
MKLIEDDIMKELTSIGYIVGLDDGKLVLERKNKIAEARLELDPNKLRCDWEISFKGGEKREYHKTTENRRELFRYFERMTFGEIYGQMGNR